MSGWKSTIVHEMVEYFFNFVYLAFLLVAFMWYRRLILAEYAIPYLNYWVPLIEAAVLAKVIMVGDMVHWGRGLERTPLLVPTLYRTMVFGALVGAFSVLEHTVRGLLQGKDLTEGLAEPASKGWYKLLAQSVVIACAFVPFFRVQGAGRGDAGRQASRTVLEANDGGVRPAPPAGGGSEAFMIRETAS